MKLRRLWKPIIDRVAPPLWRWYTRKPRRARWGRVRITVPPGVFPPTWMLSTRFLLHHLSQSDLEGKTLLELGAGSGMIAVTSALRGAKVTASDISSLAIAAIQANAAEHQQPITIVHSDLWEAIPAQPFDWIVINPPYYPQDPSNESEYAWFCGRDFEYFTRLFAQLGNYCSVDSTQNCEVRMVLSEDCNLERIAQIARQFGWAMTEVDRRKRWGELNFIYAIQAQQKMPH